MERSRSFGASWWHEINITWHGCLLMWSLPCFRCDSLAKTLWDGKKFVAVSWIRSIYSSPRELQFDPHSLPDVHSFRTRIPHQVKAPFTQDAELGTPRKRHSMQICFRLLWTGPKRPVCRQVDSSHLQMRRGESGTASILRLLCLASACLVLCSGVQFSSVAVILSLAFIVETCRQDAAPSKLPKLWRLFPLNSEVQHLLWENSMEFLQNCITAGNITQQTLHKMRWTWTNWIQVDEESLPRNDMRHF